MNHGHVMPRQIIHKERDLLTFEYLKNVELCFKATSPFSRHQLFPPPQQELDLPTRNPELIIMAYCSKFIMQANIALVQGNSPADSCKRKAAFDDAERDGVETPESPAPWKKPKNSEPQGRCN